MLYFPDKKWTFAEIFNFSQYFLNFTVNIISSSTVTVIITSHSQIPHSHMPEHYPCGSKKVKYLRNKIILFYKCKAPLNWQEILRIG